MNKKIFGLSLSLLSTLSLVSCGDEPIDLAMVTDVGNIDDGSFNQFTYEGVTEYAEKNDLTQAYFRPADDTTADRVSSIEQAINRGAKVIVCPGYLFEGAIYEVQDKYPDVGFLLLDGEPHADGIYEASAYKTSSNTHNILYRENECGFLLGYAAVKDGYRHLAFEGGMKGNAVQKYGWGYLSGILEAATELNVEVVVEFDYSGTFNPDDAIVTRCDTWYQNGVEAVFSCGGKIFQSVVASARKDKENRKVFGVDVDQYSQAPDVVVSSAMKGLKESTMDALDRWFKDGNGEEWPAELAGKTSTVGAAEGMVGLPTAKDSWGFKNFTTAEYEEVFAKLVADSTYTGVSLEGSNVVFDEKGRNTSLVTVNYTNAEDAAW